MRVPRTDAVTFPCENPQKSERRIGCLAGSIAIVFKVFCALLVGGAGWSVFVSLLPTPPIVVSEETTIITEPLAADGLPNYEAYLLDRDSAGVTPENNAAVLIWQAIWPGELSDSPEYWPLICEELGMPEIPSGEASLIEVDGRPARRDLIKWFKEYSAESANQAQSSEFIDEYFLDDSADRIFNSATKHPWVTSQLPPIAEWAGRNQVPLDLLVQASTRSRFYSPSPNHLDGSQEGLIESLLPLTESLRGITRALCSRAMLHLGEGRHEAAWQDLRACLRFAQLSSQGWCLVQRLVAFAVQNAAFEGIYALLGSEQLPPELAREILLHLENQPKLPQMANLLDEGERLSAVDCTLAMATGRNDAMDTIGEEISTKKVNWTSVLIDVNHLFDDMVDAARMPTRAQRLDAWSRIDDELMMRSVDVKRPQKALQAFFSRRVRSELIANVLLACLTPATGAVFQAEDRANAQLELTRLAAALAVYRAEQGEYPEALEQLVPAVMAKLPVDLYSGESFIYKRKSDGGYLLYSVYENEIDDGGTDFEGEIINGEWVGELPEDFDSGESDLVIRVPVPAFELPKLPE